MSGIPYDPPTAPKFALDHAASDIFDFHEKMGILYDGPPRDLPGAGPSVTFIERLGRAASLAAEQRDGELQRFRIEFLLEELMEYTVAISLGKREDAFDALLDLIYVALGTIHLHGFPAGAGWARVQAANMAKKPATDPALKVVKPEGWTPPDLTDLVRSLEERIADLPSDHSNDFDGSDGGPLPDDGEPSTGDPYLAELSRRDIDGDGD